ncbi:MAG: UTP--glucose-1-phosphate uridylyltransferase, partial [Limisphaerales bacterium]
WAELLSGHEALMPAGYYTLTMPRLLRQDPSRLPAFHRAETDRFAAACRTRPELRGMVQTLFDALLPRMRHETAGHSSLAQWLEANGFDRALHEQVRADLKDARIGLAQNRLRPDTTIEDVQASDVVDSAAWVGTPREGLLRKAGEDALRRGELAVVSLAAGAGSRWTQGAGVCKALHPFCKLAGRHRSFVEVHLAKSRRIGQEAGVPLPHLFTTSFLTHEPVERFIERAGRFDYPGPLHLSKGQAIGLRMVPTERDLRFQWEDMPQQLLDEQQQKVRESLRHALIQWARSAGEASDYTDNIPLQCLHPVGHFFEVPNLLRNGTLAVLLRERPNLRHLMLHNIDTVGANADPVFFASHLEGEACLTFEVIERRIEDRGGGLARVNGRARLVEGLAMPREEDEFRLSYYNSMTTWIDIDRFLAVVGLDRRDILDAGNPNAVAAREKVATSVRNLASRLPTYVTLKDVKKRWGHGQEDVFPVAQFEKLWSDLTALPEVSARFVVVPRVRGQQLKDQAQLDGWLRDGSAAHVESLCAWS